MKKTENNESVKLITPFAQKHTLNSGGRFNFSKREWISAGSFFLFFAILSVIFFAINIIEVGGALLGAGVLFGGLMIVPLPNGMFINQYIVRFIKYIFSKKVFNGSAEINSLIAYKGFKDNYIFAEREVLALYRVSGKDLETLPFEEKLQAITQLETFYYGLDNTKIFFVRTDSLFDLKDNIDNLKLMRRNANTIPQIVNLTYNIENFSDSFATLSSGKDGNKVLPNPIDKMYLIGFRAPTKEMVDEIVNKHINSLSSGVIQVYPANETDIQNFLENFYGIKNISFNKRTLLKNNVQSASGQTNDYFKFSNLLTVPKINFKRDHIAFVNERNSVDTEKNMYSCIISFRRLPADTEIGWLNAIYDLTPAVLVQRVEPLTPKQIKRMTKTARKSFDRKMLNLQQSKSVFNQIDTQEQFQLASEMIKGLESKKEKLYRNNIFMILTSSSLKQLRVDRASLIYSLEKSLKIDKKMIETFSYSQYEAFASTLPGGKDIVSRDSGVNLTSNSLGFGFQFQHPFSVSPNGLLLGFDRSLTNPIVFDPTSKKSFSGIIIGKSGSGKSFCAKLLTANLLSDNKKRVWWFDPENEMANICHNFNGVNIDLSSSEPTATKLSLQKVIMGLKAKLGLNEEEISFALNQLKNFEYGKNKTLLISIEDDFFALSNHDKTVKVNNTLFNPLIQDLEIQLKQLNKKDISYKVYHWIFDNTVFTFNINPLRILNLNSDLDLVNSYTLYSEHILRFNKWIKTWLPNLNDEQQKIIDYSLKKLYDSLGLKIYPKQNNFYLKQNVQELLSMAYPTFQDLYNIILSDFNDLIKKVKSTKLIFLVHENAVKNYEKILNVFDQIVPNNRFQQVGTFSHLWKNDNKIQLVENNFINFNIQRLNNDIVVNDKLTFGDLTVDAKIIATAQMSLAYDIIKSFMIQNQFENSSRPPEEKTYGFVFLDEFHKMTADPNLFAQALDLVKTGRKRNYGLWPITQDLKDLKKLDQLSNSADTLIDNLEYKLIFRTEGVSLNSVQEYFETSKTPLTQTEIDWIKGSNTSDSQGRGLFINSNFDRQMFYVIANSVTSSLLENRWDFERIFNFKESQGLNLLWDSFPFQAKKILDFSLKFYNLRIKQIFTPSAISTEEFISLELENETKFAKQKRELEKISIANEELKTKKTIDKPEKKISTLEDISELNKIDFDD